MTTRADRQRARALGKKGGRSTSPAKVAASRANLAKARAARRASRATECYAGCSLAPGHDGPCFVPAGG